MITVCKVRKVKINYKQKSPSFPLSWWITMNEIDLIQNE